VPEECGDLNGAWVRTEPARDEIPFGKVARRATELTTSAPPCSDLQNSADRCAMDWDEIDSAMETLRQEDDLPHSDPASDASIRAVEDALGVKFPPSYRRFVARYGTGGPVGAELCGIWNDDPTDDGGGTVLGATERARAAGLPRDLFVVQGPAEDGEIWCLDTTRADKSGEYPVVFLAGPRHRSVPIAATFKDYLAICLLRE
jgi:hypothetical protein